VVSIPLKLIYLSLNLLTPFHSELGEKIASDAIKKIGLRPCIMLISLPGPILSVKKFIEKMKQADYLLFGTRSWISDRRLVHKIERMKLRLKIHEEIQKQLQASNVFTYRYEKFAQRIG
jgi:hypothetical protein